MKMNIPQDTSPARPSNPYWDNERVKWYEFDLSEQPHRSGVQLNTVVIEANSAENAIAAFVGAGHCTCTHCWNELYVFVALHKPAPSRNSIVIYDAQVQAILTQKPVGLDG